MTNKALSLVGGIVLVILIVVFLILPKMKPAQKLQSSVPTPSTTISPSSDITIKDSTFSPNVLTVKKGTSVSWTNNDSDIHTVDSVQFSSSRLKKGDSFSYTFNESGTFDYSCGVHPTMFGKIIVID